MARLRRAVVIGALTLVALSALPRLEVPALRSIRASGHIVANEIRQSDPAAHGSVVELGAPLAAANVATSGADATACIEREGQLFETPVGRTVLEVTGDAVDAGQRFNFVGVHWRAPAGREDRILVEIRASADGSAWGDWIAAPEDEDLADTTANERYAGPFNVGDARYAQYRVRLLDGDTSSISSIALTFLDVSDLNAPPWIRFLNDVSGAVRDMQASWTANASVNAMPIRTRRDWGADESLMLWTPEYVPWKKAIVHHTVTSNSYTDAAAEIRSIYYFHAVSRGWGDIGYNYIVDRFGYVWQGRQGGDDVVGGHAYGWNQGSMGVANLGDFSTAPPASVMINGDAHIIAMKFAQRGIQPLGADTFTHKEEDRTGNWVPVTSNPPNIIGHRDANYILGASGGQTACPGQALYNQLGTLRANAQMDFNAGYSFLPAYSTTLPSVGNVGQTVSVSVTVNNSGTSTISAGSVTYRVLNPNAGYALVSQGAPVAIGGDLAPGQSRVVTVPFAMPGSSGRYIARWDIQTPAGLLSQTASAPWRDQWFSAVDWDVTWLSDTTPATMSVGQTQQISVTLQNTGARTWPAANVRLSYHWASDVTQRMVVWDGSRALLPSDVQPGQTVTVPIQVTAPVYPTRYQLQFDLVWEGSFWFSQKGTDLWTKTVNVPFDYSAQYQVPATLTVAPGARTTVPVTVTNSGTSTWPSSGGLVVDLGTHWWTSAGALVQWDGTRTPLGRDLASGQSVTLNAVIDPPTAPGTYVLKWDLSFEGISWFSDKGTAPGVTTVTVKAPSYGAKYQPTQIGGVAASVTTTVPMTLTNTGDFPWSSPGFNLSYHLFDPTGRLVVWDGARTAVPGIVQPGQSVTVQAALALPSANGAYTVKWDMVQEGVTWFSSKGVAPGLQSVTVGTLSYGASYDNSQAPTAVNTAMRWNVLVGVTNRSNFAFSTATNVYLSYHWFNADGTVAVWDGARSPINLAAGASGGVWVAVYGPPQPGSYRLAFDLVQEGVTWFSDRGVAMATSSATARMPLLGALYAAPVTASGAAGATLTVPVTIKNTGSATWSASQVFLAYHLYRGGALVVWDGARTALPSSLAPGQTATVQLAVRLPATAADYDLRIDLVQEGVTWFSAAGVPVGSVALSVQ